MRIARCLSFIFIIALQLPLTAQESEKSPLVDNLYYGHLAAAWACLNTDAAYDASLGVRYIPRFNYTFDVKENHTFDFEASLNVFGEAHYKKIDLEKSKGVFDPYRMWARYTHDLMQVRLGLQEIKLGQAQLFRPLMWFDNVDVRDPLQLSDGVWGGLFRYEIPQSANFRIWVLAGNPGTKGWETIRTAGKLRPEAGGSVQYPLPFGEVALSYHYRGRPFATVLPDESVTEETISENRFGFDIRRYGTVNVWLEASWTHLGKDIGISTNEGMATLGADHTFDLGKGLDIVAEHLLYTRDHKAFGFNDVYNYTGVSLLYPLTEKDKINVIAYYDWKESNFYSYASWQKQHKQLTYHVIGYWNPKTNLMHGQSLNDRFLGKGIQLMVAWNY